MLFSRFRLFAATWTVVHQATLSLGFPGQEYWSGLPVPFPGHPDPVFEPGPPALQADSLPSEPPGKTGFSSMWTENFQIYKLDFRKGRGPRDQIANICWIIKKSKGIPENTSASLTMLKPLTVWITTNWKILKGMGIPDHLTCLLRTCVWIKKQ